MASPESELLRLPRRSGRSNPAGPGRRSIAGLRLLGVALGSLAFGSGLAAQTSPVAVLPAPASPESAATIPGQPGAQPEPRWEYALSVGGGWDSNIDFLVPDGASGTTLVPRGSLTRTFGSPRGELRVAGKGRWLAYTDEQHEDRGYADVGVEGRYRASPRTSWRGSASYALGHTDTSQLLLAQGVLLPLTRTDTLTGALGLERELGTRTSLRVDGRLYAVAFEASGLVDQGSRRGTATLLRRLGARSTAALEYSLEDVVADQIGESYLTHYGSARWTRVLSPRTALLLEGGASHTPEAARAGLDRETNFFGGASLSFRAERSSLGVYVRREVAPAFGTGGSRLSLRAGLSVAAGLGRDWRLEFGANRIQPDSPSVATEAYASSDDATFVLSRRLGGRISVSGEVSYRHRGATGTLDSMGAFQAGLFVSLVGPPREAGKVATAR